MFTKIQTEFFCSTGETIRVADPSVHAYTPSFKLAFQFAAQVSRVLQPRVKREQSSWAEAGVESSSATWHFRCKATDSEAGNVTFTYIYIYPASSAFVVYLRETVHGPIIFDRYFSAEPYLVNLIESLN